MDLTKVFQNAVTTAFNVFSGLVKQGKYVITPSESGWGTEVVIPEDPPVDPPEEPVDPPPVPITELEMGAIVNGLTQKDKANTSFFNLIEPSDTIVMVKGTDIKSLVPRVKVSDKFHLKLDGINWTEFNIIDHETDPAEALFLILLREGNV